MAYGQQPRLNPRDEIRLLVGDISTSTGGELLSDVDYDYMLATAGGTFIAAQLAANSLAAKFSSVAQGIKRKQVGDLQIEYSDAMGAADDYAVLATKFGRMAAAQISPYSGGQTKSDKALDRGDSDLIQPSFARGLMDNPAVVAFSGRDTST